MVDCTLRQPVFSVNRSRSFASPCFAISFSTLYRPRLPHGSQTIVNIAGERPTGEGGLLASADDSRTARTEQEQKPRAASRSDVSHQRTCQPFQDWSAGRGYLDAAQNRVADGLRINQSVARAGQGTDHCDIGIGARRPGPVVLTISVLAALLVKLLAAIIGGAVGGPKDD